MTTIVDVVSASKKLEQLLSKALASIGAEDEDADRQAKEMTQTLSKLLYIRTPDQLKAALDDPEVLQDVRREVLRGMLLPAVRAELRRSEVGSRWHRSIVKAATKSQKAPPPPNDPLLRTFEVARADFAQLSAIDQVSQTFRARLLLILRIPGGALDSDLTREFEGFPFDDDGRPTFRPSARWYLDQIDFPNGRNIEVIESKVTVEKNDLQLIKRIEGEFFERFELQNFPFDAQDLTITVSVTCAKEGPVPVAFADVGGGGGDATPSRLGVDTVNFAFDDIWDLSPSVQPEIATVGATACRRFPAVHLRACVSRRPSFILQNVAAPTSIIAFLSLTTFFVPPEDISDRLELSITILLTAVAFKYASAAFLPQISYLTLVDRFVLYCMAVVVVANLCHAILGMLHTWVGVEHAVLDVLNKVCFIIMVAGWTIVQLWFLYRAKVAKESKTDAGQKRVNVNEGVKNGNDGGPIGEGGAETGEDPATREITCTVIRSKLVSGTESISRSFRRSMDHMKRRRSTSTNSTAGCFEDEPCNNV